MQDSDKNRMEDEKKEKQVPSFVKGSKQVEHHGKRDACAPMVRSMSLEIRKAEVSRNDAGEDVYQVSFIGSTDRAVNVGWGNEILVHTKEAVDISSATALLVNHNPNLIAGPVRSIAFKDGQSEITAEVLASAVLESGVTVREAIDSGALRGISVGYVWQERDAEWNPETETATINKWRMLENSLTPIPADGSAGLRSQTDEEYTPSFINHGRKVTTRKEPDMGFEAWLAARGIDASKLNDEQRAALLEDYNKMSVSEGDEAARAEELRKLRAQTEAQKVEVSLRRSAAAHSIDVSKFDFSKVESEAEGLRSLMDLKADADKTETNLGRSQVTVTRDAADKLVERGVAGLCARGGLKAPEGNSYTGLGGMRAMDLIARCAEADGHIGARDWDDMSLIGYAQRHAVYTRAGVNEVGGTFSQILSNVSDIALAEGYNSVRNTWQMFARQGELTDFKQSTVAALASGNLQETAAGVAFPELRKKDGGYNRQLKMWGATVTLTFQMLANDSLGEFMELMQDAGAISGRTIERETYYQILNQTWTNDVTTSAGLGTAGNVDKVRTALVKKPNPAGQMMGNHARYLLHDPVKAQAAQQDLGIVVAGGATTAPSTGTRAITPIESEYIGDTTLLAGALTTDYYLLTETAPVRVDFWRGNSSPIIVPMDVGAVAGEGMKIMLPFASTVATHDVSGTTRISGAQKATA